VAVFGLTENSPIKLKLTRENYEALILRHGQYVRWLIAEKCPCVDFNGRSNENCVLCKGKGYNYRDPEEYTDVVSVNAVSDGIVEVPDNDGIIWIRDAKDNELTIGSNSCNLYSVSGVYRGETVFVKYKKSIILTDTQIAEYVAPGLYVVNLPNKTKFGDVQGSIHSIDSVTDLTTEASLTVTNFQRNYFTITETPESTDSIEIVFTYLNPFLFAILSQDLSEEDRKYLDDIKGSSMMTFPQKWNISEDDLIIALNSHEYKNHVLKSTGEIDKLPSFYLHDLQSAYAIRSNLKHEFVPYTDFNLYPGNKIIWSGANIPEEDEKVSINYSYNTVYKVLKDHPNPRSSENNWFPRKVVLSLYTDSNIREVF
jgi:hypothetical protein